MNAEYTKNKAILDPWFEAVKAGDLDAVNRLLDSGIDINAGDEFNIPALGHTMYNLDLFRLLLDRGADPEFEFPIATDAYSLNKGILDPWFEAVNAGDLDAVNRLLDSGIDVNAGDQVNTTALGHAIWQRHLDLIRLLLDRGADPAIPDSSGHTPLTTALIHSRPFKIPYGVPHPDPSALEILLSASARYRLLEAVLLDDVDLARERLDEGEDPNYGDFSYFGPVLRIAGERGHCEIVALLLDRGADIELTDDVGWRPLASAARAGQTEVVRLLLDRGADIDALGWKDDSALGIAALEDHHEVVELLFSRGARRGIFDALALNDVTIFENLLEQMLRDGRELDDISDGIGRRLAVLAAGRGHLAILRLLFDRGSVNLDNKFREGHSVLAEAARCGQIDAVRFLIDWGADFHAVGEQGLTPLDWAIREGRDEVARVLRQAGAER